MKKKNFLNLVYRTGGTEWYMEEEAKWEIGTERKLDDVEEEENDVISLHNKEI